MPFDGNKMPSTAGKSKKNEMGHSELIKLNNNDEHVSQLPAREFDLEQ